MDKGDIQNVFVDLLEGYEFVYENKAIMPTPRVSVTLSDGSTYYTQFTTSYIKNNEVGTATAIITIPASDATGSAEIAIPFEILKPIN